MVYCQSNSAEAQLANRASRARTKQHGVDRRDLEALERAGQLNATAALWTAASVVLSALSAIASTLPL
jgi:hypothetical protein